MEVDTSADRPTLKEACHDMHGIGHYVDEYIQKKSAVNLGHGIQTDIAPTRQPAHHQMQTQEKIAVSVANRYVKSFTV